MACGVLTLTWAVVVWRWEDPITALYTMYEQHQLSQAFERREQQFAQSRPRPPRPPVKTPERSTGLSPEARIPAEEQRIRADARAYRLGSREGEALGRIVVPRLGVNMVFVDGTSESSLEKGPGRDLETFMPGENRLVYIAGHRTTFLAPFSHIDALQTGDRITLKLPYATFVYQVTRHIIVPANDLAVLHSGKHELLALQACHPRFFATHRYIVYGRPVKVTPAPGSGPAYTPR
jgi:sortase A